MGEQRDRQWFGIAGYFEPAVEQLPVVARKLKFLGFDRHGRPPQLANMNQFVATGR
jgi:hypothetical protein